MALMVVVRHCYTVLQAQWRPPGPRTVNRIGGTSPSYMWWLDAYGGCTEARAAQSFPPIWYTTFEPDLCRCKSSGMLLRSDGRGAHMQVQKSERLVKSIEHAQARQAAVKQVVEARIPRLDVPLHTELAVRRVEGRTSTTRAGERHGAG